MQHAEEAAGGPVKGAAAHRAEPGKRRFTGAVVVPFAVQLQWPRETG